MLTREIYSGRPAMNKLTTPLPIANGGLAGDTKIASVHNIGGISAADANVGSGFAQLDAGVLLPEALFPIEARGGSTLTGPRKMLVQTTEIFTITNYDSAEAYVITCASGFVTRSGDRVYYTAPATEGSYGFVINDKAVVVAVSAHYVTPPTIITPSNTAAALSNAVATDVLYADDRASNDKFGISIAINADRTRLVTATYTKAINGLAGAGQVYIYTRTGATWTLESTLTAVDKAAGDSFGAALALDAAGTRLIVGAYNKTVAGVTAAGQVYVYVRSGTTWTLEAIFAAADKAANDYFGAAIALDAAGYRLIVGANNRTVGGITGAGQVYVYTRVGSLWVQESTLSASDKAAGDFYGTAVALDAAGVRMVVGAHGKTVGGITAAGQVYVYTRSGATWTLESTLTAVDKITDTSYGFKVAISADSQRLVVSQIGYDNELLLNVGKLHFYVKTSTGWVKEYTLMPNDQTAYGWFGGGIALSTDQLELYVGEIVKDSLDVLNCGGVITYSLKYESTSKVRQGSLVNITSSAFALTGQYLESVITANDKAANDYFGVSVALDAVGSRMAIGAYGKTVGGVVNAGQVYIYTRSGATWVQESTLALADKATGDWYAAGVALDAAGTRLVVGAQDRTVGGIVNAGQVYVYIRSGSTWTLESTLSPADKVANDYFGVSVALDATGSRLAVGAYGKTVGGVGGAGQVYLYTRSGITWVLEATLSAVDKASGDYFGVCIAIDSTGTRLAVCAYRKTVDGVAEAGQIYIYVRSGTTWSLESTLTAADKAAGDWFGMGLAFCEGGNRLAASAPRKIIAGITAVGKVYLYTRSGVTWSLESTMVPTDASMGGFGRGMAFTSDGSCLVIGRPNYANSADMPISGKVETYLMSYHTSSDWQLSTDPGFVNIVSSVTDNAVNKTSWQVADLAAATDYYLRCRHKGTTYGYSDWSAVNKLTTRDLFLPLSETTIVSASDKAVDDKFGRSVSFDATGTRMVVGAWSKTVSGVTSAGQVYTYTRSGTVWTLESTLSASDKVTGDYFGISVALDATGERLIVGAYNKTVAGVAGAGQAYLYTRSGTVWSLESTLSAADKAVNDNFGISVAIDGSGSRVVVGARYKDVSGVSDAGQVYVYTRTGAVWSQESTLSAADKVAGDIFGTAVALDASGLRLAVTAYNKTVGGVTGAGLIYIYTRSGSVWTLESTLSAVDKETNVGYGVVLTFDSSGARLVVGAYNKTVGGVVGAGQVYIYTRSGIVWTQETTLSASDKATGDFFGVSVTLTANGGLMAIGAMDKDIGGVSNAGAVYLYY